MSQPTAIDLFCGAGGLSCGFEFADISPVAAFDHEEIAIQTYNNNRLDEHGHVEDLAALTPGEASERYDLDPEDVDIIAGGPPCQSFSMIGNRDPNDPRDDLTHRFFDWVMFYEPDCFMMENVPGLETKDDGEILDALLETGRELGYEVDYKVLNAAHYEVAQNRKRLFIVGTRGDPFEWPEPVTEEYPSSCIAVLDAIQEVAPVSAGDTVAYPDQDAPRAADSTKEKWKGVEYGDDPYSPTARTQVRLNPWEPANTITASNPHFHPHVPRTLTIREQAALQSFFDEYWFCGNRTERQRQVGNAVPPKLAMHLGDSLVDAVSSDEEVEVQTDLHEFMPAD